MAPEAVSHDKMLEKIKQALRLFVLLGKKSTCQGAILVLFWAEPGSTRSYCTVAAAGSKWRRIQPDILQNVLTDVKFPRAGPIPEPDLKDLCAFTDVHGCLKLVLTFQIKDFICFGPEWSACVEAFLNVFSLANATISVQLRCKFPQQTIQQEFRASFTRRLTSAMKPSLMLDVTCRSFADKPVEKGRWCPGGHPVLGSMLPLSIPPESMDSGLYGELNMQLVTLLSPCVLHYPNLKTLLTHVKVLAYTPTNVPMTLPFAFFRNLPVYLDCRELSDPSDSSIVYTLGHKTCQEPEKRLHLLPVKQKLSMFLFLQHTDPFASQLSDVMVTDALIERHLEDILNNNRQAVTGVLHMELSNTLKAQDCRKKEQEKLLAAAEVILSATVSIVNWSTNLTFRKACLSRMQVINTHELAGSLHEALLRVISWRCVPRKGCYSVQVEECLESAHET
ncbi:type 2 DNA topoisomerase 6 subunit B-like isoform X1 [Syngnathus scovelli]|uniref:type 2 DNA topoisomerase 6 subunit B-like isoform X1 n=1 Tax=Syngnathus scovelli TaxID=161590 RepID=UPI00210FC14E|nr:DUF4554 domain-containing protein isoform X1 [Syngnathus scovelli]